VIPGRSFHEPVFPTADGRAKLHVHELPELAGIIVNGGMGNGEFAKCILRLMTIRSEGQFNTVVYEDYDLYRGVERRDVILIHPDDIARLGLKPGERVRVTSESGEMQNVLVHSFADIKPGNAAMYYPEANALVPRRVDPLSKTPAFKCVVVSVEAMPDRADERSKKGSKGKEELVTIVPADGVKSSRDQMRAC
jgi:anaerobic selenocysteine-containing dehydrogenase